MEYFPLDFYLLVQLLLDPALPLFQSVNDVKSSASLLTHVLFLPVKIFSHKIKLDIL